MGNNMVEKKDWTTLHRELNMTYGGLHENEGQAKKAYFEWVRMITHHKEDLNEFPLLWFNFPMAVIAELRDRIKWMRDGEQIKLEVGQKYHAWSKGPFIHGIDDTEPENNVK
jgi:hypothetical protein